MTRRKITIGFLALMGVVLMVGAAQAGFLSIGVDYPEPGNPGQGKPPWAGDGPPDFVYDLVPDQAMPHLKLTETYGGSEPLPHIISGETDVDPVMTISKDVENDSGFTWVQYLLSLPDGGTIKFDGTPTSDKMNLVSMTDYLVVFEDSVNDGEIVNFTFGVLIPSSGPFQFTLTQQPVPEPAALVLLALGGIALWMIRRRR